MYKKKKFGVFGLGISGIATLNYLKAKGAEFIAYDDGLKLISSLSDKYPEFVSKFKDLSHSEWEDIDYLILSPGIPSSHPVVEIANKINAKIICDIELLYIDNPTAIFVGITGTNGKSTTTALITHILKYNGFDAMLGGNIGTPVLALEPREDSIFIIEASSFQLDLLDKTKFDVAILLNITPDHLDRHGNMENYIKAKYRIFSHQTDGDIGIINIDLKHSNKMMTFSGERKADLYIIDNQLFYLNKTYIIPNNNSLLGKHNKQNIAASISACIKLGLNIEQIVAALPSFVGLKHRMQYLGQHNQVTFINDSKATNADSTEKALLSFDNIIWIVGGVAKEGGIESLTKYFSKIKTALLIGESQDDFALTSLDKLKWQKCGDLENAFKIASSIAKPGDVVLLSPACASYDQWKNFEERGDAFIELVKNLP